MTNIGLGQTIDESFTQNDSKDTRGSGYFVDKYDLTGLSNWQQVEVSLNPSTLVDKLRLRLINASTDEVIEESTPIGSLSGTKPVKTAFTVYPGVDYKVEAVTIGSGFGGDYTITTNLLSSASSVINLDGLSGATIGTVDSSGNLIPIETSLPFRGTFRDIAVSSNSQIFGFSGFGNDLYRIDPKSNSFSIIEKLDKNINWDSLEFAPNGLLYGLGRPSLFKNPGLYTIDTEKSQVSLIAEIDPNVSTDVNNLTFDTKNNQFIATGKTKEIFFGSSSSLPKNALFFISLTGKTTKITDLDINTFLGVSDIRGLYFDESNTLIGFNTASGNFNRNQRIVIDPVTGSVTPDGRLTSPDYGGLSVTGASSIPSATRSVTAPTLTPPTVVTPPATPPTVVTPTPPPPTVVTPTPLTLPTPPPTSNNIQQPSTNTSSISITSASDLADGDQTLIPGGTIRVNGLGTGINTGTSNLNDFLFDNLKVFLGDIPIPLTGISSTVGSSPVQFGTNITLPNNISPGNYPLKLVLNTGTGSSISGVGPTLGIIPANATGAVDANFAVNSITDQKLKGTITGVTTAITDITGALSEVGINIPTRDVKAKLQEASDKFPYGYLPDDLLIKDDLGKLDPSQRNVNLKFVPESSTQANKTWIVIHGWNVSADDNPNYAGDFADLGKAVAQANPDDRVLLLDWKEAATGGKLNETESDIDSLLRLGNYTAAKWIRPVAQWVVTNLKEKFGVDAEYASKNLNLIGHSLGSLLSNEIARVWQEEQTAEKKGIDQNGKGRGVNTIFVLDPPSQLSISALSLGQPGFGYDVDGRTPVMDFISPDSGEQQIYLPNFKEVSNFSRAFVGRKSLAGNQIFAAQADESFQMSFSDRDRDDTGQEHLWVVEAFKNLIIQKNELADIGKLVNPNPILTDLKGKEKAYDNRHAGILAFNTPTIETKDIKDDQDLPKPRFLTVENKDGGNLDDIVYGTNEKDTIIFILEVSDGAFPSKESILYSGAGNDIFYGKAGDDLIFGGSGNDTIYGEQDKDSINGAKDNDILFGGENDDIIWGGKEDDTLIGGKGKDTLTGGLGSDIFVFAPGDGAASRDEADIITDFGTGFIVGGGTDRIGLAGGLKADMIQLETFGGTFGIGERTALKANGQYLAVLNSKFSKNDLNFLENFSIV